MSNLSILEQNIMLAIEGAADGDITRTEEAQAIFLRFKDRDILKAERAAYEWASKLSPFLNWIAASAAGHNTDSPHAVFTPEEVGKQAIAFVKERHIRRWFPKN
jgi:hypothetical protein